MNFFRLFAHFGVFGLVGGAVLASGLFVLLLVAGSLDITARKAHRLPVAIWAVILLVTFTVHQFGRSGDIGRILFLLFWLEALAVFALVAALLLAIRESWRAGLRSFVESIAAFVVVVAAAAGIYWTCRGLGLGHWPPRDAVYVRHFREKHDQWRAERDRVLREVKAAASDPDRNRAGAKEADSYDYDCFGRVQVDGANDVLAYAAKNGSRIWFPLYEGTIHINPVSEKGLLYVTPEFLAHDDRHWLERVAVEDLGDGWYVYEN